jgi:curli biogenesis system outer membrane secretion channel CsgG
MFALPAMAQDDPPPRVDNRPRVAIMEIPVAKGAYQGWGGWGGDYETRMSDVLRDLFTTEFVEQGSGRIRLIDRAIIQQILDEQNFMRGGDVDTGTAVRMGKMLGVKYMVTGKITRFSTKTKGFSTGWGVGALVGAATRSSLAGSVAGSISLKKATFSGRLDMRVVDVETGEILVAINEEGKDSNMNVKVAGGGVEYEESMVNDVFEPIVKAMSPKLINRILSSHF